MAKKVRRSSRLRSLVLASLAILVLGGIAFAGAKFGNRPIVAADTPNGETKTVIVTFKNVSAVTSEVKADAQRAAIDRADSTVAGAIPYSEGYKLKVRSYDNLPYAVYVVDEAGEASLKRDPNVAGVADEQFFTPSAYEAVPTVGGNTTTGFSDGASNYTGNGFAVAVLDTGILGSHAMLSGKVIAEACFSAVYSDGTTTIESVCPNGQTSQVGAGSAQPCDATITGCDHGTHVASLAAGNTQGVTDGTNNYTISGVAKSADIVAVQVFSKVTSFLLCGSNDPCALSTSSSQLAGLDYVIGLAESGSLGVPIAAVNMSIGGSPFYADQATCDGSLQIQQINTPIASLRNWRIPTVIATGNSGDEAGNENKVASPSCAAGAVAVSATNKAGTAIASYANNGPLTDLLAPGGDQDDYPSSLILGASASGVDDFTVKMGTSMAAPMVTGAFAVLREKHPNASVDTLLSLLQSTGTDVTDNRAGYTVGAKKRINVANALTQSPRPVISDFAGPAGTVNEGASITLTANVSNATSCSLNNGVGNVSIAGGAISVSVPGAASYTLTCTNSYADTESSTVSFTINAAPTAPVVSEHAYDTNARTFKLVWGESSDANGVLEYRVYLNGQLVATLPAGTTEYTFANIVSGTAYTAEVRAVDTLGAISSALSVPFGGASGAGVAEVGAPNTGVMGLLQNAQARSILVAALGLLTVISIVVAVKKRSTR